MKVLLMVCSGCEVSNPECLRLSATKGESALSTRNFILHLSAEVHVHVLLQQHNEVIRVYLRTPNQDRLR